MEKNNVLVIKGNRSSSVRKPEDPKDLPIYSIAEVARSLRMDESVLAEWTQPQFEYSKKKENFRPLVQLSERAIGDGRLSFYNALEAHVLLSLRRHHGISMLEVRRVMEWVRNVMPSKHPLVDYDFQTKGRHLFIKRLEETLDASLKGQIILGDMLDLYLKRIRRDESGIAQRLVPIIPGSRGELEPVMMDMRFASGRLVIFDTGIQASVIYGRYLAGHTVEKLSRDYRLAPEKIEGAIEYLKAKAA